MSEKLDDLNDNVIIFGFFKIPRTEKEAQDEWGEREGDRYFMKMLNEGYIEDVKDKPEYYQLSETGKKHFVGLQEEYKKEKRNDFWNKPFNVAIVTCILTALVFVLIINPISYQSTTKAIDYEKTLTATLYGKQGLTLRPGEYLPFNSIILYNPTSNKVTLTNIYIKGDSNWEKWNRAQKEETKQTNIPSEKNSTIEYDIPELETNYKPYMELEAGESRIMEGLFSLNAPIKTGEYKLYFFAETLDGKHYEIDRPLIVKVIKET